MHQKMKINHFVIFVASFIIISLWTEAEGYAVIKSRTYPDTVQPIRRFLRLRTIPDHANSPTLVKDAAKSTTAVVSEDADAKTEGGAISTDSASSSIDSESTAIDANENSTKITKSEVVGKPLEVSVARYQPIKEGGTLALDPSSAEFNISQGPEGRFFWDWFSSPDPYRPIRPPYGPPPGPGYYPPRPSVVDDIHIHDYQYYDEPQYEDCVTYYDHDTHEYFDECKPIPPPYFKSSVS